jgi:hypothetical protein
VVLNVNEALVKIRGVGANKVRSVPMSGQNVNSGFYQIEILEGAQWVPIVTMVQQATASDLIKQATNRTICG